MRTFIAFAWGAVASALAYAFCSALPHHEQAPVLISFTVAVVLVAWFQGRAAGLFTWAIGLLAAYYFIASYRHTYSILGTGESVRLISTSLISLAGVFVVTQLHSTLRRNAQLLERERAGLEERDELIAQLQASAERLHLTQKAARAWNWEVRQQGGELVLYRDPKSPLEGPATINFEQWLSSSAHPEDFDKMRAALSESFDRHVPLDIEFRLRSPRSDFRWLHARGNHVGDTLLGVTMDITSQKTVEDCLRRSEQHFEALSSATFEGIAITSDWRIVDVNAQLAQMLGYTAEEMIGQDISGFAAPEDREHARESTMTNGGLIQLGILRKDGSRLFVEARSRTHPYQGRVLGVTSIRDITEQKQAERSIAKLNQDLQRRAAELQAIFETVPIGLAIAEDPEARHIRGNPANEQLVGVPNGGEFSLGAPQPPSYRVMQDGRELTVAELPMQRAARGEKVIGKILDVVRADGRVVTLHTSAAPIFDERGKPRGAVGAFVDITERKNAEEALRQSREELRAMAEALPHILWSCDARGQVEYISQHWFDYTGLSREESFTPDGYLNAMHPDDRKAATEAWKTIQETGDDFSTDVRMRRASDGQYRWHATRIVPLRNAEGKVVRWFGTLTDIEDTKRAQASLIQSEKLASTGRMAATIAHEINNPLAAAMNALYLIAIDRSLSKPSREMLELADSELRHAAQITRQTLGFYREDGLPAAVSLSDAADALLSLYAKRIRERDIMVRRRYRSVPAALAIEGELRQMIANLLVNALDATPKGGIIHVRTTAVDGFARITIADTGTGIVPEHLARVFEAFFTTKEKIGTGLGLWIVRELASKHRGSIRVRSIFGRGTVFILSLPIANVSEPIQRKQVSSVH